MKYVGVDMLPASTFHKSDIQLRVFLMKELMLFVNFNLTKFP